jgi:hypothetical protein
MGKDLKTICLWQVEIDQGQIIGILTEHLNSHFAIMSCTDLIAISGQDVDKDLPEVWLILYDEKTFLRHACNSSDQECLLYREHN